MREDSISIVTLTRSEPEFLRRAMASVHAQDFTGDIEHVIVIDDDPESVGIVDAAPRRRGLNVTVHMVRRPPSEVGGHPRDRSQVYPRQARLFNHGVRVASGTWIAFLDHDNEFEPNHVSSLLACATENNARAVHSARQMMCPDGSPYLEERWHTAATPEDGARIFELMCERGIWVRGTNILQDRADPVRPGAFVTSTMYQSGDAVHLVDQSCWLLSRDLLLELPIPEMFTAAEIAANTGSDDKLVHQLVDKGVPIYATRLPTVRFYLGGLSNNYGRPKEDVAGHQPAETASPPV